MDSITVIDRITKFLKEILHHLQKRPVTTFRMSKGQKLVQRQLFRIVSRRIGPPRSVPHDALLQRSRHLLVPLIVRTNVTLRETVQS